MSLKHHFIHYIVSRRGPDVTIGGQADPYLRRWWLLPRNRFLNVYLHQFLRSDDDRALHDHPWLFNLSVLLSGEYVEHTIRVGGVAVRTHRKAGDWKLRFGAAPHRIELLLLSPRYPIPMPCWTLFITGPRVREWGFHCPAAGWIPWKRFTSSDSTGCDA